MRWPLKVIAENRNSNNGDPPTCQMMSPRGGSRASAIPVLTVDASRNTMSWRSRTANSPAVVISWMTDTRHNAPDFPSRDFTSDTVEVRTTLSFIPKGLKLSIDPPAHMRRGRATGGRNRPLASAPSGPSLPVSWAGKARHQCKPGEAWSLFSGVNRNGASVALNSALRRGVTTSSRTTVLPIQDSIGSVTWRTPA